MNSLGGACWSFDEVGAPEEVMVRETSSFAKGTLGIVGGARLQNGRSIVLVDLDAIHSSTKPVP